MSPIEDFLCATLRGEHPTWPRIDGAIAQFLDRSAYHGVQALLHQHMGAGQGVRLGWPEVVLDTCRQQAIAQALWEMRHQYLLNQVLAQLSAIGIQPILFKGTALAYSLYAEPFLRIRSDTDLIVPTQTCERVGEVLEALGFKRNSGVSGEFISYQASYSWSESIGHTHTLDLHWRINNFELLSKLFSYQELHSQAKPLPKLGPNAIAVGEIHAIIIACMHRMSHNHYRYYIDDMEYDGGNRLIWLYDIHLLMVSLSPSQHEELIRLAEQKGFRSVCLEGIEQARACFHTAVPETTHRALTCTSSEEPIADYLNGTVLYQQWANFQAIDRIHNKLGFITEVIFPPASYMRHKYPDAYPSWLPWLYLRRVWAGIGKRLKIS